MGFNKVVERLDVTRARIESSVSEPAVIAVTSANAQDGRTLLATALAHSFAAVGYPVLLVSADQFSSRIDGIRPAPKLSDRPDYDILSFVRSGMPDAPDVLDLGSPGVAASCSKETTEATFARFRSRYRFTVVHTSALSSSGVAFSFVSASDQVVLAFLAGRAGGDADRNIIELLRSGGAKVAGTVLLDRRAVKEFETGRSTASRSMQLTLPSVAEEPTKAKSVGVRAG